MVVQLLAYCFKELCFWFYQMSLISPGLGKDMILVQILVQRDGPSSLLLMPDF